MFEDIEAYYNRKRYRPIQGYLSLEAFEAKKIAKPGGHENRVRLAYRRHRNTGKAIGRRALRGREKE